MSIESYFKGEYKENRVKKKISYSILAILIVSLMYITNITGIPDNILLIQGEKLELDTIFGISVENKQVEVRNSNDTMQVSSNIGSGSNITSEAGKLDLELKLGKIPVKEITVNVIPKTTVLPLGNIIRVKAIYRWNISSWNV